MSENNYLFTTISYGKNYHKLARDLAEDLAYIDKQILIFTDSKDYFEDLDNVILFDYSPLLENDGKLSGYDKDRIAEKVFEHSDCMWYIDSDWRLLRSKNNFHLLDEVKIKKGLTSAQGPNPTIHSDGYPKSCIEWARERYKVTRPLHYGEACYTIREGGKTEEYLRILLELGRMHDQVEMAKPPKDDFISKSSGVSFGFARQASKLRHNNHKQMRKAFYSNFRHMAVNSSGKFGDARYVRDSSTGKPVTFTKGGVTYRVKRK